MAGHSPWKNIRHKKAAADAKRGKAWSKCARAIIVAARNGGGDPEANLTLRYAIDEAKAVNMPKDTIEKAVKKGTGELASEHYDAVLYEGYGPGGAAFMLDILTDNRNRTAPEIKKVFEIHGGNLGAAGAVSYLFQPRGVILLKQAAVDENALMTLALDAGALDVVAEDEHWRVVTEPADFRKVRQALEQAKLAVESAELTRVPTTTVTLTGDAARKVLALVEELEDHDDVQKVYANFEIPDSELAAISG